MSDACPDGILVRSGSFGPTQSLSRRRSSDLSSEILGRLPAASKALDQA